MTNLFFPPLSNLQAIAAVREMYAQKFPQLEAQSKPPTNKFGARPSADIFYINKNTGSKFLLALATAVNRKSKVGDLLTDAAECKIEPFCVFHLREQSDISTPEQARAHLADMTQAADTAVELISPFAGDEPCVALLAAQGAANGARFANGSLYQYSLIGYSDVPDEPLAQALPAEELRRLETL